MAGYIPVGSLVVVVVTDRGRVGPVAVTELPTVPDELADELAAGPTADQLATLPFRHGDAAVLVVFTGSAPIWSAPVRRLAGQLGHVAGIGAVLYADADSHGSYGDGECGSWSLDDLPVAARLVALRPVLPGRDAAAAALDPGLGGRVIPADLLTGAAADQAGPTPMVLARRGLDLLAEAFKLGRNRSGAARRPGSPADRGPGRRRADHAGGRQPRPI